MNGYCMYGVFKLKKQSNEDVMRNTILIMPETSHRDSEMHGIVRRYWFIWALYTQPSFLAPQGIFVGSNPKCPQNTNPHVTKNLEIQPSSSAFLNGPWLRHLVGWWIGLRYSGTSMGTNSTRLWGGWLDGFRRKLEVGPPTFVFQDVWKDGYFLFF